MFRLSWRFLPGSWLVRLGPWYVNQCKFVKVLDKFLYLLQIHLHAIIFGFEFTIHLSDNQLGVGERG